MVRKLSIRPSILATRNPCVFVLREAHVIKPASDPLVVQGGGGVLARLSAGHKGQQDLLTVKEIMQSELLLKLGIGECC